VTLRRAAASMNPGMVVAPRVDLLPAICMVGLQSLMRLATRAVGTTPLSVASLAVNLPRIAAPGTTLLRTVGRLQAGRPCADRPCASHPRFDLPSPGRPPVVERKILTYLATAVAVATVAEGKMRTRRCPTGIHVPAVVATAAAAVATMLVVQVTATMAAMAIGCDTEAATAAAADVTAIAEDENIAITTNPKIATPMQMEITSADLITAAGAIVDTVEAVEIKAWTMAALAALQIAAALVVTAAVLVVAGEVAEG
jgi:hypothetical protein